MNRHLIGLLFMGFGICAFAQTPYKEQLRIHRDTVNQEFADSNTSILTKEDQLTFHGLEFFVPNEKYKIKATFQEYAQKDTFEMATSTSRKPQYRKYGMLTFTFGKESYTLEVYQNIGLMTTKGYEDYLFCPFKDLTNGKETYGGGRYLDLRIGDLVTSPTIDFNFCYNPYCAYNYNYSCPVPPAANHLKLRIEAGVKDFKH